MPSGAKRRKAAKKKKQGSRPNSPPDVSQSQQLQQGNENPQSYDSKGSSSSSSEANSPTKILDSNQFEDKQQEEEKPSNQSVDQFQIAHLQEEGLKILKPNEGNPPKEEPQIHEHVDGVVEDLKPKQENPSVEQPQVGYEEEKEEVPRDLKPNEEDKEQVAIVGQNDSGNIPIEFEVVEKKDEEQLTKVGEAETSSVVGIDEPTTQVLPVAEALKPAEEQVVSSSQKETQFVEVTQRGKSENLADNDFPSNDKEKMLPTSTAPHDETGDGKEMQTSESSRNQVVATPPAVRTTSWKSCCGLFDVLMGSDRQ